MASLKCLSMCAVLDSGGSGQTSQALFGGPVGKNRPVNAGDVGLTPGPGRSHMPWSN